MVNNDCDALRLPFCFKLIPCNCLFVVSHVLLTVNGSPVTGRTTEDGRDVFEVIEQKVYIRVILI